MRIGEIKSLYVITLKSKGLNNMKRFLVTIPEVREELVLVEYEIEVNDIGEIQKLIDDDKFLDKATYLETKDSIWGFDVKDILYDKKHINELKGE
jgi:hypothetical protein